MDRRQVIKGIGAATAAAAVHQALAGVGAIGRAVGAVATGTPATGFYSDPFSSYSSFIADTTFAGTDGTNTTVNWGSGTLTAPTYKTAQGAISAAASNYVTNSTPSRACFLAGQTWDVSASPLNIPYATGSVATSAHPFVIQGDPAASPTNMPKLSGNAAGTGALNIGSSPAGGSPAAGYNNSYTTVRKLEVTNFSTSTSGVYGICLATNYSPGSFNGSVIEYSWGHLFRATGSAGESGPIYCPSTGATESATIRYCILGDVQLYGGGTNDNMSAIGLYGGQFTIENCEIYGATHGVRFKSNDSLNPTGSSVANCYIHDCLSGICTTGGSETVGPSGVPVTGCFFGWQHLDDAVFLSGNFAYNDFDSASGTYSAGSGNSVKNCTISQEWAGGFLNVDSTSQIFENNLVVSPTPIAAQESGHNGSIATCDYNWYWQGDWYLVYETPGQIDATTFAAWQSIHTNNPTATGLTADPDAHGGYIPNLTAPYNTLSGNFPNLSTADVNQYALAAGSPLNTASSTGAAVGYTASTCGPGWTA